MNRTGLYFTAGVVTTLSIILVNKWLFSSSKMNASISGRKKVLFFGDSITQHGFNPSEGWISSLAYWWSRRVDILNRGFSGYNTKWGLSMIDKVVIAEQPDLVFVFFGANDAVDVQVTQHVPLEMFKQNMRQIIDKIQKNLPFATVIVISPPPVWEPLLAETNKAKGRVLTIDRTNDRTYQYVVVCREIGISMKVAVLDLWSTLEGSTDNRKEYLIDGLHLNTKGNQALFSAITSLLKEKYPEWLPEIMPMHMPEWSQMS